MLADFLTADLIRRLGKYIAQVELAWRQAEYFRPSLDYLHLLLGKLQWEINYLSWVHLMEPNSLDGASDFSALLVELNTNTQASISPNDLFTELAKSVSC